MADVRVVIQAIVKPFEAGLNAARTAVRGFADGVRRVFGSLGGQLGAALSVAGLARFTQQLFALGDQIDKGSKRAGVSAEEYQKLGFAAKRSGADFASVETAMRAMANVVEDASRGTQTAIDSLGKLGLRVGDLRGKTPYEQFLLLADALNQVSDASERSALAVDVFGRGGTALLPMITDVRALGDELQAMNGILDNETVAAAARASDAWTNMMTRLKASAANSGLTEVLGGAAEGLDELTLKTGRAGTAFDVFLDAMASDAMVGPKGWKAFPGVGHLAEWMSKRREAKRLAEAGPSEEVSDEATARRRAEAEKALADRAERDRVREQTQREIAARREKDMADRTAADAARKAARLAEYMSDLQEQVRIEQLIADGKERQARIEQELLRARKAAIAAGLELSAQQEADIAAAAGRIFDLRQKETQAEAEKAATLPRESEPTREFSRLRQAGGGIADDAPAQTGTRVDPAVAADIAKRARLDAYLDALRTQVAIERQITAEKERQARLNPYGSAAQIPADPYGFGRYAETPAVRPPPYPAPVIVPVETAEAPAVRPPPAPDPVIVPVATAALPKPVNRISGMANMAASVPNGINETLNVDRASLRRLESIDKTLAKLAGRPAGGPTWP